MKKVYIPTMEELETLQKEGRDVYNYILAKVIETLIMEDTIYDEIDMCDTIYDEFEGNSAILYPICKMYPERINDSILSSTDIELRKRLIMSIRNEDSSIYRLDDYLFGVSQETLFDEGIVSATANQLVKGLSTCSKYRFSYRGPNDLLDCIFNCEIPLSQIPTNAYDDFIMIDPVYFLKLGFTGRKSKKERNYFNTLERAMIRYLSRYELMSFPYQEKDIVNSPDESVKKLIRHLENHREKYKDL